ncbi:MAG: hypothetical protein NVSMB33_06740 [Ktedonobacteraceae bacterium]
MVKHTHSISRLLFLSFCLFGIPLLLAACDFGGGTASAPPTTSSASLTAYTGDGFTISYPRGWKVKKESNGVTFSDPNGIAYVTIHTSQNPGGVVTSDTQVNLGLQVFKSQAKNYQKVTVPATTTIAAESWAQGAATGDVVPGGKSSVVNVKLVVDSDNHPADQPTTRAFVIVYATGSQIFDLANTSYFQPMLQSFKFI